jgi:FKBP-type peptidyl-prolyl cis-trans isomerase
MNINHNQLLLVMSVLIVFAGSCSQDDFKTDQSGYQYKIVRNGDGPDFINNHYIFMNMDYYYEEDSLLFTSMEKGIPVTLHYIDTVWDQRGQIYQGLQKLKVGDSAIFKVNCSDLFEVSFRGNIPYGLNPFSDITVHIGIIEMMTPAEFRIWQASLYKTRQKLLNAEREQQLLEDISLIDIYLEESGLIAMELESGIRYIVNEEGNGIKPEKRNEVVIHYTGYLLDGTKFDSSYDKQEPLEFVLGASRIIKGWQQSVSEMSVGSKYTFYIPSTLAYGEVGLGEIVGPNEVVVYDIELLEIK